MNSNDAVREIPKRRRTSTTKSIVPLLDLNSPPAEETGVGVPSISMAVSHNQASSSVPPLAGRPQSSSVETIDDGIMIYPSRPLPQRRQQLTRTESIPVIIDDDPETNLEPAGEALDEPVNTLLSLGIKYRYLPPVVPNDIHVKSLLDAPEVSIIEPPVIQAPPEPVKEPKLTCPVCLNELREASSTSCGHIFCQGCIKAAIRAQKKCPTCRKKLGNNSIHRVYLPNME